MVNILSNGDFEIIANTKKSDESGQTDDLTDRWSDEIVGLQKKNLDKVLRFIEAEILAEIMNVPSNLQIA